jgi:ribosome-binding ATPase YchF (GTP1/OBG family)
MRIGIIGPPQSGKTTLFKVLLQADTSSDIGVFKFIDQRIDRLNEVYSSKKKTYPEVAFIDIGHVSGLNAKDYAKLQDIDLFICVIDAFFNQDPKKALESYITDIIISDLEAVQNRVMRIEKEKAKVKTDTEEEERLLKQCQEILSEGKLLYKAGFKKDQLRLFSGFEYISLRPIIAAINLQEGANEVNLIGPVEDFCSSIGLHCIRFFGKAESEILELDPEERPKFSREMGLERDLREDMAGLITKELRLITFFTVGEKETKGWHLESGLPIIEAAGKIHSDMKRGFIRAEVVNYDDFIKHECNMQKVRESGLLKVEGKEYIVKDGDILNIRFNV